MRHAIRQTPAFFSFQLIDNSTEYITTALTMLETSKEKAATGEAEPLVVSFSYEVET